MCRLNMSLAEHLQNEEDAENRLSTCDNCGEPLYDGIYWNIVGFEKWCEGCVDDFIRSRQRKVE